MEEDLPDVNDDDPMDRFLGEDHNAARGSGAHVNDDD